MPTIKVGLAGYGYSAQVYHMPFILSNPDLELVAIFQRPSSSSTRRSANADYPTCTIYPSISEFIADPRVELVVVATGDEVHAEISIKALSSGKHVVCEKPLARTSEEANRMIQAQTARGKLLFPFQNRRYDSDIRTVQSLIQRGAFGEIHEFEAHYDFDLPSFVTDLGDGRYVDGLGLFFMVGVHKLDQVMHLFGAPSTVTGFTRVLRPNAGNSDIEDSFTVILAYSSKLVVTVKVNTATKLARPLAYVVRGYKGSFIKFGGDRQEDQIKQGVKPNDDQYGTEEAEIWGELTTDTHLDPEQQRVGDLWVGRVASSKGSYALYYEDVVEAIRGGEVRVKPETSRDGLRIIELARESARKGVTLPFA